MNSNSEFLRDPEATYEDWDDPIRAYGRTKAAKICKSRASQLRQSGDDVEYLGTESDPHSKDNRDYLCKFRTYSVPNRDADED